MNKYDLIDAVSRNTNFTKENSSIAVNAVIDAIFENLSNGNRVTLKDLGTFDIKILNARKYYNFDEGKLVEHPKSPKVTFKPSKNLNFIRAYPV